MNTFEKYVGDRETNADTEEVEADHGYLLLLKKQMGMLWKRLLKMQKPL